MSDRLSERTKTALAITVAIAALAVVVIGLVGSPSAEPTAEERVEALSATIKCPFCNGESLAESSSGVAGDYRALIAERVDAGFTDEEIRQEFSDNFGEAFILETSADGWSLALWLAPVVVLVAGAGVIVSMRRSEPAEEVSAE